MYGSILVNWFIYREKQQHVHKIHKLLLSVDRKQRKLEEAFFYDNNRDSNASVSKKIKRSDEETFIMNRRFCIWLCRDLLPMKLVENRGFKDFWSYTKDGSIRKAPSRSTVSREALDDVFQCLKYMRVAIAEKWYKCIRWMDGSFP